MYRDIDLLGVGCLHLEVAFLSRYCVGVGRMVCFSSTNQMGPQTLYSSIQVGWRSKQLLKSSVGLLGFEASPR